MLKDLKKGTWPPALSRNFPSLTIKEQEKLLKARVVVVGLGGLGGYLSTFMARMGTGHLVLVDGDVYDPTNLNRQLLADSDTIGQSKAKTTAEHCRLINPKIKTTIHETHFSDDNGEKILKGADVVLDGLDQVAIRKILFSKAMSKKIPFIHGAVAEWYGQTSTFMPESPFTLDSIYKGTASPTDPPSVLAPTVAVIAAIQAMEAVKIICGHPPANIGKLAYFDGQEVAIHKISLKSDI